MTYWKAKVQAAHEMVDALCKGKREWVLSIPVRYDHDPDVIISKGLMAAEAEIAALEATLAKLREIVPEEECADYWCPNCKRYQSNIVKFDVCGVCNRSYVSSDLDPIRAILYAKDKDNG